MIFTKPTPTVVSQEIKIDTDEIVNELQNIITDPFDGLTDAQLRAAAVLVNTGLLQGLTDAQLRAAVVDVNTGLLQGLTNAQLRAVAVLVDTGLLQGLTDSQLRASAVVVNTGLLQGLTDAQLRASAVAVTGNFSINEFNSVDSDQSFCFAQNITAAINAIENNMILLKNPSASGIKVFIRRLFAAPVIPSSNLVIKVYANPTITTNGTAMTVSNSKIGGAVSAGMTAFSLPTISVKGTLVRNFAIGNNDSSQDVMCNDTLELLAGNNVLITCIPDSNNRVVVFTCALSQI